MKLAAPPSAVAAMLALACAAPVAAAPALPDFDALQLRPETASNGIALNARWAGDWGRMQARTSTLREPDGRVVSTTRAWWQSELPQVDASLRLGSQQAAASFVRHAIDLSGFGLAGRLAPLLADYALAIGRQQPALVPLPPPVPDETTGLAALRRALGGGLQLGLHVIRVGPWQEFGALLEGMRLGPWQQRIGLLQTRHEDREQQRLVIAQQLKLDGITLAGRIEQVLARCSDGLTLPMASHLSGGCSAWRGDARLPLATLWTLDVGAGVRRDGDQGLWRQTMLATTWRVPGGTTLRIAVQRNAASETTQQRIDASLSWPIGGMSRGRLIGR